MVEKKRRKERYEILFEEVNSKMDLVLEGYRIENLVVSLRKQKERGKR